MERYVCVHGHYYQPQRENPWLEEIEVQDSAAPFHDWNERVTAECYAPNARARRLGPDGRIEAIVDNYAQTSFNFGPTLLGWHEQMEPDIYRAILEADARSRERFSGHGNALAQVHGHVILPLANDRDRRTQVVWGIRDFERRFGRAPEGMWLAETAVDVGCLEVLAEHGIRFTILAPQQARAVRRKAGGKWRSVEGARIDPTTAYECKLPSGRSIALFFYDGPISRAVAFEKLLDDGARFAERLASGFSDARQRPQLVHIATDGETYGHHHRHGEMALAWALHHVESSGTAKLTNYGEFLARHPPQHLVQIEERTSWSCSHGIERWWKDCGCNGGKQGWNQAWRTPLRDALDWLRDRLAEDFERLGSELLREPWEARDGYVEVLLERTSARQEAFLDERSRGPLDEPQRVRALRLLESQRNALLMYTSCGWFFDDLGGVETVQVIQYAARALELARDAGGGDHEAGFVERLSVARGNVPDHADGGEVYRRFAAAARLDLAGIAAHYAVRRLFDPDDESARVACYSASSSALRRWELGRQKLVSGVVRITSDVTRESADLDFAALHLGDHEVRAGARPLDAERQRAFADEAGSLCERGEYAAALALLDRAYEGSSRSLRDLYRDERRRLLERILAANLADAEASLRRIHDANAALLRWLTDAGAPQPEVLRATARFALGAELREALAAEEVDVARVRALLDAARAERVDPDAGPTAHALERALVRRLRAAARRPGDLARLRAAAELVELARSSGLPVELWEAQNLGWEIVRGAGPGGRDAAAEERARAADGGPGERAELSGRLADGLSLQRT